MSIIKVSKKQKEVIALLREGRVIRWMEGLHPRCFVRGLLDYKISTATVLRLEELSIIERTTGEMKRIDFILTEAGKSIQI